MPEPVPAAAESAGCILVVDDDRDIRTLLVMALSEEGYAVTSAHDGAEALERLRVHHARLILLDYGMPVMDGPAFVRAYRQLPGPHAPIVLVTAAVSAVQRAAELGADAYLGKPFDLADLYRVVEREAAR